MVSRLVDPEPAPTMSPSCSWRATSAASFSFAARWSASLMKLQFLADRLGLAEEVQIVGAAGLGVGAGHIESAERIRADHRAGALAIDIEIADVELAHRAVDLLLAGGVDRAGQTVLGVVGDGE